MGKSNAKHVSFGVAGVLTAIGIVYGDIGTSPLYVMKSIVGGLPLGQCANVDYILGAVSCIIWTLTIQTTVKYVLVTLRADNNGEGGILSLFALIRKKYKWAYIIAIIGASTLLADGVITPSITVVSAIEGLKAHVPDIPVEMISLLIIVGIFLVQPLGTAKLGRQFGKIMFVWFLMLGALGAISFVNYPMMILAFNPMYAVKLLANAPSAYLIIGAVFLCTTGAEALYSDLGHCGLKNIRISWIFVKAMLIINYLGQGAWIITHPANVTHGVNPFFCIMPGWFSIVGIAMGTMAAIIASQALISGSFTIISEAISLNLWPNVRIKYPAAVKGQMFIPQINYALMTLCVIIVLGFRTSSAMESAYGLAITITMLMTTALLAIYFHFKKYPLWVAIPLTTFFVVIECFFLMANMMKFISGGWVTILIAGIIGTIMYVWRNGGGLKNHFSKYEPIEPVINCLKDISQDTEIPKYATHLVYVTRAKYVTDIESKIVYSLINRQPKRADTYWFVYLYRSDDPYCFRYRVTTFVEKSIFRIDIYSGFKQGANVDRYVKQICAELAADGKVDMLSRYPSLRARGVEGDYRFVVVERSSRNLEVTSMQKTILQIYDLIRRWLTSDIQILDLDPSVVTVEYVPLKAENRENSAQ
jgi:KUP system potassium uptake protein